MDAEGISRLFAGPVSACVATPDMYEAPLFPEEEVAVARAVVRRRREFTAGRASVRAALGRLGAAAAPIVVGEGRAPVWPAGYVASITHCEGFCCAVAARSGVARGIGVDAEDALPLTADMARMVCRPDELARFAALPAPAGSSWSKLAFAAKEAFYKCYFPLARTALGFDDVSVRFSVGPSRAGGGFRIVLETPDGPLRSLQDAFDGRWRVEGGRVYAGVTLPGEIQPD